MAIHAIAYIETPLTVCGRQRRSYAFDNTPNSPLLVAPSSEHESDPIGSINWAGVTCKRCLANKPVG